MNLTTLTSSKLFRQPAAKPFSFTELNREQLQRVRGGDLCIDGYEWIDEDGDGTPDVLIPIYVDCLLHNPRAVPEPF
jgi:hypothetical protein